MKKEKSLKEMHADCKYQFRILMSKPECQSLSTVSKDMNSIAHILHSSFLFGLFLKGSYFFRCGFQFNGYKNPFPVLPQTSLHKKVLIAVITLKEWRIIPQLLTILKNFYILLQKTFQHVA